MSYTRPMAFVREGSSLPVVVNFYNSQDDPDTPTSFIYRVDLYPQLTQVLGWTPLAVSGTSATILIPSSVNTISDPTRDEQVYRLTTKATFADGSDLVDEFWYVVRATNVIP